MGLCKMGRTMNSENWPSIKSVISFHRYIPLITGTHYNSFSIWQNKYPPYWQVPLIVPQLLVGLYFVCIRGNSNAKKRQGPPMTGAPHDRCPTWQVPFLMTGSPNDIISWIISLWICIWIESFWQMWKIHSMCNVQSWHHQLMAT